ncbi:hypothetical protein E2C01_080047 [Portunus trituberculatus]|uniref:Uncharacterized protein n=1 Tax=Portunus trituberculatus TaxID=210409 RepID=A0A5B7IL50_PORTR|nr:hypothetical protein [Portunus trituberculatus]
MPRDNIQLLIRAAGAHVEAKSILLFELCLPRRRKHGLWCLAAQLDVTERKEVLICEEYWRLETHMTLTLSRPNGSPNAAFLPNAIS